MSINMKLYLFVRNARIFRLLSDKTYLKYIYKLRMSKKLDFNNTKTFNEKLQWLKLFDRQKKYTTMVDKYEAKKYVSDIIGKEYIIPTLGIYDKFGDINFDSLPNQFVIKCTHDSGGLVIVKDKAKVDFKNTKKKIKKCLNRNYYYSGREWPYKNVKPRIIIEKYMEDNNSTSIQDYKFFCFGGKVNFLKVDFDRFIEHRANYFDINFNIMPFGEVICPPNYNKEIKFPSNIYKMIELAEKLAVNIPFVRVDFYNVDGQIYFGEITFYPASGLGKFEPEEWDRKLGDMLELPKQKIEEKNEK